MSFYKSIARYNKGTREQWLKGIKVQYKLRRWLVTKQWKSAGPQDL